MMAVLSPSYPQYLPIIQQASSTYGVPWQILAGIAQAETSFGSNPNTYVPGKAGEIGIMQLTPGIAQQFNVNPYDPTQNINGAAAYLSQLYTQYGNWPSAVAAYNGSGPAAQQYSTNVLQTASALGYAPNAGVVQQQPSLIAGPAGSSAPGGNFTDITDPNFWTGILMSGAGTLGGPASALNPGFATDIGAGGNPNTPGVPPAAPDPLAWLKANWPIVAAVGGIAIIVIASIGSLFHTSEGGKTTIVPIPA